jgi:glycosyltransferase involved in cell wall biosynthesis
MRSHLIILTLGVQFFSYAAETISQSHIQNNALTRKRVVVIIASYNNEDNYERNLTMLLAQECPDCDFVALYFEDASTDNTYELVKAFLEKHDIHHRVSLIHNETNQGSLANIVSGIAWCRNSDIIICYDGDDFFPHIHVIDSINKIYSDPTIVATYGQYAEFPSCRLGYCKEVSSAVIDANGWRDLPLPLPTSHPKTFYAGIAKQIKCEDYLYQGKFFPTAGDLAFFWPILEMAGHYAKFIPEVLYVYRETDLNDYKVRFPLQMDCFHYLKNKERYQPLPLAELHNLIYDT